MFVYAIKSQKSNYIYVGISQDVHKRLHQHNSGYEKTTKPYLPFDLIYTEFQVDRPAARSREKYLKSGVGKTFLRSINK